MHRVNKPVAAIHPELEAELKEEIAKIEPKVAQGTVTVDEANHLHSLEARAHGHTEKGGITSLAQSVAAKRERQLSLSSGSTLPSTSRSRSNSTAYTSQQQSHDGREINQPKAEYATKPKTEQGTGGHPQPSISEDRRKQALSNSSNVAPYTATKEEFKQRQEQSQHEKVVNLKIAEMTMGPKGKNEPNDTTTDDVVV